MLLRRDWEFLFDQLKSTYAVLEYLHRVGRSEHVPLGTEPVRYYQLATADLGAPKVEIDSRLAAHGYRAESVPLLPMEPATDGNILRAILEDIASFPWPEETEPADVLSVLAAIDGAPIGYRAELGHDILGWLDEMADVPTDEVRWRFRRMDWPERPRLIFGSAPRLNAVIQEAFESLVRLRHQEHTELMPERGHLMTVGILLTPRDDGRRPWDTTLAAVRGEQDIDLMLRSALEELFGKAHVQR